MEIDYGPFRRQIALGADVDVAQAHATYERGMLTIVLPLAQRPPARERVVDRGDARVSDAVRRAGHRDAATLPPVLPVLPLKETVVFPESMTPLAIGQERSIKLIDDVVAGERLLALVDGEERGGRAARLRRPLRRRHRRDRPQADPRPRRDAADPRPGHRAHPARRAGRATSRTSSAEFSPLPDELDESREVEALTRNVQSLFARVIALVPYLPEELQLAAANVEDPSALCHLVASTLRIKTEEKQRLLELVERRGAAARGLARS